MLLHNIRLKNFLGHRGPCGVAGDGWIDIDFRSDSLWLVHGPNGSGKSSLWDALSFALFKEYRGGKREFRPLIHDLENRAELEIVFELQGQLLRIRGKIAKKKSRKRNGAGAADSLSTEREIQRHNGDHWETVAKGENDVNRWIQRNFPVCSETFHSAILLQQGNADRFLTAGSTERRTILTQLLRLSFYQELDKVATRRYNEEKRRRDDLQREIELLPAPTDLELSQQRDLIQFAENRLTELEAALKEKHQELYDARRAQKLTAELSERERQHENDSALLSQAEHIRTRAQRLRSLREGVRLIEDLWEVRNELERAQQDWQKGEQEVQQLAAQLEEAARQFDVWRNNVAEAATEREKAQVQLAQALQKQNEISRRLVELARIEELERAMEEERQKLIPHQAWLQQRAPIQQRYARHRELRDAISRLKRIESTEQQLSLACAKSAQAETQAQAIEKALHSVIAEGKALKQREQETKAGVQRLRDEQNRCQNLLQVVNDKLNRRGELSDTEECPTCGSRLDEPDVRKRLRQQLIHWQEESGRLEAERLRLSKLLIEAEAEYSQQQQELEEQRRRYTDLSCQQGSARSDCSHTSQDVARCEAELNRAREEAGEWANQLGLLERFEKEFAGLADAPSEKERLDRSLQIELVVNAAVATLGDQLAKLPSYDASLRQQLCTDVELITHQVTTCKQASVEASMAWEQAQKILRDWEMKRGELQAKIQASQQQAGRMQERLQQAEQKATRVQAQLSGEWADSPARDNEAELNLLRQELNALRDAEEQEIRLQQANDRSQRLRGEIEAYSRELGEILPARRRPVEQVESEQSSLEADKLLAIQELEKKRARLRELAQQRQLAENKQKEIDETKRKSSLHEKLYKTFGKSELLAVVIQDALGRIKHHANQILGRLSAGRWQVDLKTVSETELEILAYDSDTGTQRPFEILSGGEKFRVAISVAIAIGQSVLGDRTVDTLVIDEGFGSLDNNNRNLMIQELQRLSAETLQRGRIIVVSHQDDVCESFPNRYRLERNSEGYVKVERNPG